MILTFVFIIMALLGIILIKSNIAEDAVITGAMIEVLSSFCLIVSLMIIILAHVTANMNIQKNKIEYEGLCKRYEVAKSEYEDVSKSDVIADITAWNMKERSAFPDLVHGAENPWTSWFNPREIADNLEYIPLE